MIVYPAVDLRGGKVVRLREGNPDNQTIFSEQPVQTVKEWIGQGAEWIHMVNLDGAFAEANDNGRILEESAKLGAKIQFGGGLRDLDAVQQAFDRGAARVVLGTAAILNPEIVEQSLEKYGVEKICVALDARDGKIATHGWKEISDHTPIGFGRALAGKGLYYALYTDVRRDGSLFGVNVHDTIALARNTGLKVIASGGISRMEELVQLKRSQVIDGVVIGMALYEGKLTLAEAFLAAKED